MRIKELRLKNNMTQADLAKKLKLKSKSTISMWESGARAPNTTKLRQLALALNCSINDLFDSQDGT